MFRAAALVLALVAAAAVAAAAWPGTEWHQERAYIGTTQGAIWFDYPPRGHFVVEYDPSGLLICGGAGLDRHVGGACFGIPEGATRVTVDVRDASGIPPSFELDLIDANGVGDGVLLCGSGTVEFPWWVEEPRWAIVNFGTPLADCLGPATEGVAIADFG